MGKERRQHRTHEMFCKFSMAWDLQMLHVANMMMISTKAKETNENHLCLTMWDASSEHVCDRSAFL